LPAEGPDSALLTNLVTYSEYSLRSSAVEWLLAGTGPSVTSVDGSTVQVAFLAKVYGADNFIAAAYLMDNVFSALISAEVSQEMWAK